MKKSHFLQTLYLQKPLLLILLIATMSTLPWIGLGDFYTKGEPREAVLAVSMIEKGEWVIPSNYVDEFAYKPPLNHWMIAAFSILFNDGEVTPFTSRLPSTLAFIGLVGICFMFFARRRSVLEAFIASLIVITCFEIHRAAMTTRVDMVLTFFLVAGIIQLFIWYEKKKARYLLSTWFLLSMATLSKGPVGILVPCMIFGAYLLLQRENFFKATLKCIIVALPSLLIPLVWYYAAYQVQGEAFLSKVFAENFGRFLSMDSSKLDISYELGVENPWYYYPITLVAGFLPWTILLVVSLFYIKYQKIKIDFKSLWNNILSMDKVLQYSLLIVVLSLAFFTIPTSKRSVYIMLIYPFIALFIARFFIYLSESKACAVRISTGILIGVGVLALTIFALAYSGIINVEELSHHLSKRERTLRDMKVFSDLFRNPGWLGLLGVVVLLGATVNSIYLMRKKMNLKILMAGFGMMLALNILLDAYLLAGFKNAYSTRPFAEHISAKYDLNGHTYVTNELVKYRNLYGLNFYMHNSFKNIAKEMPDEGYFITLQQDIDRIKEQYKQYDFELLETSSKFNEYKNEMLLFRIKKNIEASNLN